MLKQVPMLTISERVMLHLLGSSAKALHDVVLPLAVLYLVAINACDSNKAQHCN